MSTSPFGAAGFGFPTFDAADWQRASSQWFAGMMPASSTAPTDPFAWLRGAGGQPASAPAFDPTALATQWLGQIQQLAAQVGDGNPQAADIVRAWKSIVGDNPFASGGASAAFAPFAFTGMPGGAGAGGRGPFDMPAFGMGREHQERAQAFAKSISEYQEAARNFQAIVSETSTEAFKRFEALLAKRGAERKPVDTSRALFDLWIDAAEEAYADAAVGQRFQTAFGEYVNSQMRVRAGMQKEVELNCAQWGIPGRGEVDAAHRKVAELQREVRRLRDAVELLSAAQGTSARSTEEAAPKAPAPAAAKSDARELGTSKVRTSKVATSKVATSKVATGKVGAGRPTSSNVSSGKPIARKTTARKAGAAKPTATNLAARKKGKRA